MNKCTEPSLDFMLPTSFGGVPSIMLSPINSSDGGTFEQERCMDLGYHEESWSNSLLSSMFEFLIEVYFSRDGFIPNEILRQSIVRLYGMKIRAGADFTLV